MKYTRTGRSIKNDGFEAVFEKSDIVEAEIFVSIPLGDPESRSRIFVYEKISDA